MGEEPEAIDRPKGEHGTQHGPGQPGDEAERRQVAQQHVLHHVHEEEVLLAEGVDRRVERDDDERDPEPEEELPEPCNRQPAARQRPRPAQVEQRRDERRGELERLQVPGGRGRREQHPGSVPAGASACGDNGPSLRLFHYHLVTSDVRGVEARYLGKLGFRLVGRHGRAGETRTAVEPGVTWDELDRTGFVLTLTELERGAVNVVLQPGRWRVPRLDHVGVMLDEDEFQALLARATSWQLPVQQHGSRRALISTEAGYRIEAHPPRDWIENLAAAADELSLAELQLRSDGPERQAGALAAILDLDSHTEAVEVGGTIVRFLPGGPPGRPELYAERFT